MAHPDMDALLDEGLRVAIHFLEKNGEFFPFGVTMSPDGYIVHSQPYSGEEHTPSQKLIDLLIEGFLEGALSGEYKATALIYDVCIPLDKVTKKNAICVTVEHADDNPVACLLPYIKNGEVFEFGEIFAEQAERRVFIE